MMGTNSLIAAAAALQRLEGVAGAMLCKGQNMIHSQMPFGASRSQELAGIVQQMMEGYAQVRRKMRLIYLEFDGGNLLIVPQDGAVLMFLLTQRADPDLVASAASVLFSDHAAALAAASTELSGVSRTDDGIEELVVTSPRKLQQMTAKVEPAVNQWGGVRKAVEGLLTKVMGRAQASNLIDRTVDQRGVGDPYRLTGPAVRQLATAVIEHVPNVAKRRQLLGELQHLLEDFNL